MYYLLFQVRVSNHDQSRILIGGWHFMLKGIVVVTGEVTRFQVPMLSTENGFTCGVQFEVFSVKF